MLADTLPAGTPPASPAVLSMLQSIPPDLWNGYNLAETPDGKTAGLTLLREWIGRFGLSLL